MLGVIRQRFVVGVAGIALLFAGFAVLLFGARRPHTGRIGGIGYWQILAG